MVWRRLFGPCHLRLVLVGKDEVGNITHASAIRNACEKAVGQRRMWTWVLHHLKKLGVMQAWTQAHEPRVSIYSVTSLYGAESLLTIGEQSDAPEADKGVPVSVRRVDWTRAFVESTLDDYPLFLLGKQPPLPTTSNSEASNGVLRRAYLDWQNTMLNCSKRHVIIVGAGHVGLEFLRMALSFSRFCAPEGKNPLSIRFDVFDNKADPLCTNEPRAKRRFEAGAPGFPEGALAGEFNTHFHLVDALDTKFVQLLCSLDKKHGGITYVFIALGDDRASVQVSLRVRETLERLRVRRNAKEPSGQRKAAYLRDPKPLILTIVDDNDLSESLAKAKNDGFDFQIETVGSYEKMYTFDLVFGDGKESNDSKKSEYKRRSSRASKLHKKYKLFAFMQCDVNDKCRACTVNWSKNLYADGAEAYMSDNKAAIQLYNAFAGSEDVDGHRWLMRMEHNRWNAYMWAEGFEHASLDEVETFFNTCQTAERHRLNGANLHPCLVPYEELPTLDEDIDAWYDKALETCADHEHDDLWNCKRYYDKSDGDKLGQHKPFDLQDNDYLKI